MAIMAPIMRASSRVVGILVTTGDRQYPRAHNVVERMDHAGRIARIGNAGGKLGAAGHLAFGLCHQQNPTIPG